VDNKITAEETLALDIGEHSIKCAKLSLFKGQPQVDVLQELSIEKDQLPEDLPEELRKSCPALQNIGNALLITAVPSSDLLVRPVTLKISNSSDIDAILKYQLEPLLPFSLEESIIEKSIISQNKTSTQLSAYALPKSALKAHLAKMQDLQIEPEVVSCTPKALATFAHHYHRSPSPQYVLHFQARSTLCLVVSEGKVLASYSAPATYEKLINALCQDRNCLPEEAALLLDSEIDIHKLEKEDSPILFEACNHLKREISKVQLALQSQSQAAISNHIVLTGPLASALPVPESYTPMHAPQKYQSFAIAIGLALSALHSEQDSINFRKEEYSFPHPWRRPTKPLLTFAALCCTFAIALHAFFTVQLSHKRAEINNKYIETRAIIGDQGSSISILDDNALSKHIRALEKKAKKTSISYALQPNVPTVTQVLQWLNEHPVILNEKTSEESPLVIDRLNYILVSYPTESRPSAPYRIKIEMDFHTQTPQLARKLREALTAPDSIIDTFDDVTWTNTGQKYSTSFFLLPLDEGQS
jgi:type IV pilus assembly protein PilM